MAREDIIVQNNKDLCYLKVCKTVVRKEEGRKIFVRSRIKIPPYAPVFSRVLPDLCSPLTPACLVLFLIVF
ncbi:hypothetical protein M8J75_014963 [Diaphorina citri]|nr:hypothetical protein M8J75_014963 [Diaphorina citri]